MRKAKVYTNARAEKGISKLAGCSIMMFIGIECGKAMLTLPFNQRIKHGSLALLQQLSIFFLKEAKRY
jgi:hypothetical protein